MSYNRYWLRDDLTLNSKPTSKTICFVNSDNINKSLVSLFKNEFMNKFNFGAKSRWRIQSCLGFFSFLKKVEVFSKNSSNQSSKNLVKSYFCLFAGWWTFLNVWDFWLVYSVESTNQKSPKFKKFSHHQKNDFPNSMEKQVSYLGLLFHLIWKNYVL